MNGPNVLATWTLAAVLLAAALAKLRDRDTAREAVAAFGVPDRAATAVACTLITVELTVGAALLAPRSRDAAAWAALALLLAFTAVVAVALARGKRHACSCFGGKAPIGPITLLRNGGLVALAAAVGSGTGELVALGALATIAAAVSSNAIRSHAARLPRVGAKAPDLGHDKFALEALVSRGAPLLLVFVHANCGPCRQLVPVLAGWQVEHAQALTLVMLETDAAALKPPDADWQRVVHIDGAAARYGVPTTPIAVAVGADRRVTAIAEGPDAIARLVVRLVAPHEIRYASHGEGDSRAPASASHRLSRTRLITAAAQVIGGGVAIWSLQPFWRSSSLAQARAGSNCGPTCARTILNCPCNNRQYTDVQVCLRECHVTLGCFTNICAPVDSAPDGHRCGTACCEPGEKCLNGQCMSSCPPGHAECECTCCPPEQMCENGTCKPKLVCGPDVTAQLAQAHANTRQAFASWSPAKRKANCTTLVASTAVLGAWDVSHLGRNKAWLKEYGPGCASGDASCTSSVQIDGQCFYAGSANYSIFGAMMGMCRAELVRQKSAWAEWFTEEWMIRYIALHKANFKGGRPGANAGPSANWAVAGRNNWPGGAATPSGDRPGCAPGCSTAYAGPSFSVLWYPDIID